MKISLIISALLLGIGSYSIAQTVQGSIAPVPGEANSVYIVMRPSANMTGQLTDFQFALAFPQSVASNRPTATFTSLITNLTLSVSSFLQTVESIGPSGSTAPSYVYTFSPLGSNVTSTTYLANMSYNICKVSFSAAGVVPATIKMVQLPNGGITLQSNFYVAFNNNADATNPTAPFFGTGAVNDGAGYGGYSFVPMSVVLPTKFLSFYANKTDDNAKLTWTVDNEEDNSYFEVEASTDARTFKMVQKVNSLHNGRSSNTYELTDSRISRYSAGIVYYRIKQVEASGRIIYSDVRQVILDGKNFVAALYPNPVKTITKLVIEAPEAGKVTVVIRDAAGKAVKQINLQLQKGTNQQELDASAFAAGDYNLTIISDKMNQTIKMTKSN